MQGFPWYLDQLFGDLESSISLSTSQRWVSYCKEWLRLVREMLAGSWLIVRTEQTYAQDMQLTNVVRLPATQAQNVLSMLSIDSKCKFFHC